MSYACVMDRNVCRMNIFSLILSCSFLRADLCWTHFARQLQQPDSQLDGNVNATPQNVLKNAVRDAVQRVAASQDPVEAMKGLCESSDVVSTLQVPCLHL